MNMIVQFVLEIFKSTLIYSVAAYLHNIMSSFFSCKIVKFLLKCVESVFNLLKSIVYLN